MCPLACVSHLNVCEANSQYRGCGGERAILDSAFGYTNLRAGPVMAQAQPKRRRECLSTARFAVDGQDGRFHGLIDGASGLGFGVWVRQRARLRTIPYGVPN